MRKHVGTSMAIVALVVAVGCSGGSAGVRDDLSKTAQEKRTIIPVEAQLPTRGAISNYFETNSWVEAERRVQVTPEAAGQCKKVLVEEGDEVETGQILAELDKDDITAQIRSAQTQLSKARSDFEVSKGLYNDGLGSKNEFDNARFGLEQQQANVEQLNVQLRNTTIRAPISGIVTKKEVQVGQLVGTGTPIFEVVDPKSYMLVINPPEKMLNNIKIGQAAKVTLDSVQGEEFAASVRKINPSADRTSGTVKVTLDFDDSVLDQLRESAFCRVKLVLETRDDALLVPKDSVIEENARRFLFVVEAGDQEADPSPAPNTAATPAEPALVAKRVEISTGLEDSEHIEILSGVEENAKIVTVGHQTLKAGSEVKITNAQDELLAKANLSADEALKAAEAERAKGARKSDRQPGF